MGLISSIGNVFDTLGNVFFGFFDSILNNLLFPFALIIMTILFFVLQYYLIKLYILLFANIGQLIVKAKGMLEIKESAFLELMGKQNKDSFNKKK